MDKCEPPKCEYSIFRQKCIKPNPYIERLSYCNRKNISKKDLEEIIEDLVKKRLTNDVTEKNYNPKISKIISNIEDTDLSEEQLEELKKAIEAKKNNSKNKNI